MQTNEPAARPGSLLFVILFLIASLILLALIGSETKYSARGQLFAQPRTWPAIGILGMVLFSLALVVSSFRSSFAGSRMEFITWARSLEFLVWFMVYVTLVPVIGYLLATVIFTTAMAVRLGYRNLQTLLLAGAMGIIIVVVFKAGLSVKIPGGAIYDYLPDGVRNFMITNL